MDLNTPTHSSSAASDAQRKKRRRHRSPFRYPGGKSWLLPDIRKWLAHCAGPDVVLVEPFAGGANVGLEAAFDALVAKVVLVEIDIDVASVWETIINGDGALLADMIDDFDLTTENVSSELSFRDYPSMRHRAFTTLLRNRVNRGGIMAPGAGLLKNGEDNKGLKSRWYPKTLCQRIHDIASIRDRLEFIHGDGISAMQSYQPRTNAIFFIDPPYVGAGKRLYSHSDVDHAHIFHIASNLVGDFLMTYDPHEDIRELAVNHGFQIREKRMTNTHHREKVELLISRGFAWYDDEPSNR